MAILVDTGPLYALADQDDQYHDAVTDLIEATRETLIVPGPVVPEICYLLQTHLGPEAEVRFLRSLVERELLIEHFVTKDLSRAVEILEQYRDAEFGMVDATVMAMAERLKIRTILTIDHRDFRLFRPSHCRAFHIIPDLATASKK